jgi:hypothetical protein
MRFFTAFRQHVFSLRFPQRVSSLRHGNFKDVFHARNPFHFPRRRVVNGRIGEKRPTLLNAIPWLRRGTLRSPNKTASILRPRVNGDYPTRERLSDQIAQLQASATSSHTVSIARNRCQSAISGTYGCAYIVCSGLAQSMLHLKQKQG